MVEGKGIGIGIGIGVVMGILIGIIVSGGLSTSIQSNPIADIIQADDARLAHIEASYSYENDRLAVALIFTNKDAEYTKADGHLKIRVVNDDGFQVYSNEYDVTRDDFLSWKTISGEKITGYRMDINKYFSSYGHDVYVTFTKKDGSTWNDLHDSFWSLN